MKNKHIAVMLALVSAACVLISGCSRKEKARTPVKQETEKKALTHKKKKKEGPKSYLTGLELKDKGSLRKRPVAVMIPNDNYGAIPQKGLSYAGVIYEAPVEPPYTRLMAVFDQDTSDKTTMIGPVRSCRLYYCYFALEYDAVYAHFGESEYAKPFLKSGDISDIDGMDYSISSTVFWRDKSRKAPDNAFTSGKNLLKGIAARKYRTKLRDDYKGHFRFAKKNTTDESGQKAIKVYPGYPSNVNIAQPWFEYNKKDGLYYRYEFNSPQKDALVGKQLSVKNIIIQTCRYTVMPKHNTYDLDATGGGEGYYISNGAATHVKWRKDSEYAPARYYDDNGSEIEINPGRTWVCIIRDRDYETVSFKE